MAAHGITPAWAGKRSCCLRPAGPRWDHPRAGGEKFALRNMMNVNQGSPPHMRGKAGQDFCPEHRPGITPAWAGKRLTRPAMTGTPRDHPRVGGEKIRQSIWYSTT